MAFSRVSRTHWSNVIFLKVIVTLHFLASALCVAIGAMRVTLTRKVKH
jgi:hypothetical protein